MVRHERKRKNLEEFSGNEEESLELRNLIFRVEKKGLPQG